VVEGRHHVVGVVFRVRQRLKGSLWFVPFLGGVLGAALGQLVLLLDHSVQVPEAWQYSASTASEVLSVLVGAMVGLLGFVITVSVLVVQMAAGTLSPRFMRLWYRDLLPSRWSWASSTRMSLTASAPTPIRHSRPPATVRASAARRARLARGFGTGADSSHQGDAPGPAGAFDGKRPRRPHRQSATN
jgi:hypothetical protein